MNKATVIYLKPEDFRETFDEITPSNYRHYLKSESLDEMDTACLVFIGDFAVKNRYGETGIITPVNRILPKPLTNQQPTTEGTNQ